MEREQGTRVLPVITVASREQQKEGKLPALSSLKITNEANPLPVKFAIKSGCGKCG